jgi:hypothetical protein
MFLLGIINITLLIILIIFICDVKEYMNNLKHDINNLKESQKSMLWHFREVRLNQEEINKNK